jgi:hypothetical protein
LVHLFFFFIYVNCTKIPLGFALDVVSPPAAFFKLLHPWEGVRGEYDYSATLRGGLSQEIKI